MCTKISLSQGEKVGDCVCHLLSSPETGEVSQSDRGVDKSLTAHAPSLTGRTGSSEEALNVLLCLVREALPSATRGLVGVGLSPLYFHHHLARLAIEA